MSVEAETQTSWIARAADSDIWHSFKKSKITIIAAVTTFVIFFCAAFAPLIAPQNPFDPSSLSLLDSYLPPVWQVGGDSRYLLGTDDQGRGILSTLMYGSRISLAVGFASVIFAAVLGISLGLLAGYAGGRTDAIIMRIADIQLTFPSILIALLIDGSVRSVFGGINREDSAFYILVFAIGLSFWVQYARTVRSSALIEKNKEYVQAAQLIGLHPIKIMVQHVLPNVMGPVLVIATINLALAIILEATLSFLGVGMPPTLPSLGTMINTGNNFLFSGEWWMIFFPGLLLAVLALAVNLLGDWLRDALNPRLR